MEKLNKGFEEMPTLQDHLDSIVSVLNAQNMGVDNSLPYVSERLRRMTHTMQKIAYIAERQAAREQPTKI